MRRLPTALLLTVLATLCFLGWRFKRTRANARNGGDEEDFGFGGWGCAFPETTGPATVSYGTRDGTAKATRDYIATSGTLSFAPLQVEKVVTAPILDNAAIDGRRALQLYLTNAVGAEFVAPPLAVTIRDDEVGFEPGTIKRLADGRVRMIVQVLPWQTWDLEVSSDLQTWTSATNVSRNFLSPFETEFIDPEAANFPRRFYRMRME